MHRIRQALINLGAENPELRPTLRPIIKSADGWETLPKGWTDDSVKKFWKSLTGENKHKVTKCMKKMEGKFDDPGAFCASLADKVEGTTMWRGKKAAVDPKFAADIKRLLSQVFAGCQPYVKDWGRFLRSVQSDIAVWPHSWATLQAWDIDVAETDSIRWRGRETSRATWELPPEYDEGYADVVSALSLQTGAEILFRTFPRKFAEIHKALVSDRKGFMLAVAEMLNNRAAVTLLGKLMRASLIHWIKEDPQSTAESFEEVYDVVAAQNGPDSNFRFDTMDASDPQFKITGQGLLVWADARIGVTTDEVPAPEESRYASQTGKKAVMNPKTAVNIKGILAQIFAGVEPYVKDMDRFIRVLAEDVPSWPHTWEPTVRMQDGKVSTLSSAEYEEMLTDDTYDTPADWQTMDLPVAGSVSLTVEWEVVLRTFPRMLVKDYRSLISDPAGFMRAMEEVLDENSHALARLMRVFLGVYIKDVGVDAIKGLSEEIYDLADKVDDYVDRDVSAPQYFLEDVKLKGRPEYYVTPTDLSVTAELEVGLGTEVLVGPDRYASTKRNAMNTKQASKTKKTLAYVFSEAKPFLRDWGRFLNSISYMDEWTVDWGEPGVWNIDTSEGVASVQVGDHHPHDPDYRDMDVDVVNGVNAQLGTQIDFRELTKRMLGWYGGNITDRKGFAAALLRIGKDREKLVLLGKTLAPLLVGQYHPDVKSRVDDELFAADALQLNNDFDYEIEDVDFGRGQFKIVPNGLRIWADTSVSFDVTESGRRRWASSIASRVAKTWMRNHRS